MLVAGKKYLSALPVTVDGWPLHHGGDFLPPLMKGGGACEYIRSLTALFGHHRHLQPVYAGQK